MNTTSEGRRSSGAPDTQRETRREAEQAAESVKQDAQAVGQDLKAAGEEHARSGYQQGRDQLATQANTLSDAVDDAASTLEAENHPLGDYARELAGKLSKFSDDIGTKSLEQVADDTRRLARENPALFLVGSVVVGVAASRFFKASDRRSAGDYASGRSSDYASGSIQGTSSSYSSGRDRTIGSGSSEQSGGTAEPAIVTGTGAGTSTSGGTGERQNVGATTRTTVTEEV